MIIADGLMDFGLISAGRLLYFEFCENLCMKDFGDVIFIVKDSTFLVLYDIIFTFRASLRLIGLYHHGVVYISV